MEAKTHTSLVMLGWLSNHLTSAASITPPVRGLSRPGAGQSASYLLHLIIHVIPREGTVQAEQAQVLQASHLLRQVGQPSMVQRLQPVCKSSAGELHNAGQVAQHSKCCYTRPPHGTS